MVTSVNRCRQCLVVKDDEACSAQECLEPPNLILPLLELEENRARISFTGDEWWLNKLPNVAQMMEEARTARAL